MEKNFDMNSYKDWAKNEVELAIKETETAYIQLAYEMAYEIASKFADCVWNKDVAGRIASYATQLICSRPLTPYEDKEDQWKMIDDNGLIYEHKRCVSLLKMIDDNRNASYTDLNRLECIEVDTLKTYTDNNHERRLLDEMYPIKFPYLPIGHYTIYTLRFEEEDTKYIMYHSIKLNDGTIMRLCRYFKIDSNGDVKEIETEEAMTKYKEYKKEK